MKSAVKLGIFSGMVGAVAGGSCALENTAKVDCGWPGVTQSTCESQGCCWLPVNGASEQARTAGVPWCYYTAASSGYSLTSMVETDTGYSGTLQLVGAGNAVFGQDIKTLKMDVVYESEDIVRVKITDATKTRWEIPESVVPRPHASSKPASTNFKFTYTQSPFSFEVTRISDGQSVFKMDSSFVFKDQYLELTTSYDKSAKTFGLGESTRVNHALATGRTYTMWAADIGAMSFDRNLYGSYPFYLQLLNGKAHGALLLNSNGMDVSLQQSTLTFKPIGGIIDLYVFTGGSPQDVVTQYTSIIGRPIMMPYWSLGFHNCKWGYESVYEVESIVDKYAAAGIPLDTQWMDIDYMQDYRDFTLDAKDFPQQEVTSFVTKLHQNGQHFVPIIDPGIMIYNGYDAYERGLREGLFLRDLRGDLYGGKVWPGPTYFPDFLHPDIQSYWTDQLRSFHDMVAVDGIWIDMNEVSNFCNLDGTGQVCNDSSKDNCGCTTVDSTHPLDFPPYSIHNTQDTGRLGARTVSPSALHYGNVSYYNTHNLYGLSEQIATNYALTEITQKRPFVLSRSSFVSTGTRSAKWTGDNAATWQDLQSSIISIMDFNLFGVPMIGADICGFNGNTNEELCARWIEVGAFYPFSRDHNAIDQIPQELYLWDSVATAARNALGIRYQVLPYLYTLFYQASVTGSMVVRALWANFPEDPLTSTIERQFMLGDGLLLSPVLEEGATAVTAYFPAGNWYRFGIWEAGSEVDGAAVLSLPAGVTYNLSTPLTATNVHVRGGTVLPLQSAAMNTALGRQTPFRLVATLCPGNKSFGKLFWDDGEQAQLTSYLSVDYMAEKISDTEGYFQATVQHNNYATTLPVESVMIVGLHMQLPSKVMLNGVALPASQVSFDTARHTMSFTGLNVRVSEAFKLVWS